MATLTNNQTSQGFVLVTALILMMIMTSIAVTLMSISAIDLKMTNAAQQSVLNEYIAKGDTKKALQQELLLAQDSHFLWLATRFPADKTIGIDITPVGSRSNIRLFNNGSNTAQLNCPAQFAASSEQKCNILRLESRLNYGKKNQHLIVVHSGLIQELNH
ncbi:MAG: hypothetical protein HRU24_02430 [Gammaproteobacteria bacterium]|nr:hypothetical protein [Gammaproteobacteria bacterium]